MSFSADAYVNEMGITSPLQPDENTSNGRTVPQGRRTRRAGLDDEGVDVELFALFMRSTKAPPVDAARAASPDARGGQQHLQQHRLRHLPHRAPSSRRLREP